jgi:hypothetical protein
MDRSEIKDNLSNIVTMLKAYRFNDEFQGNFGIDNNQTNINHSPVSLIPNSIFSEEVLRFGKYNDSIKNFAQTIELQLPHVDSRVFLYNLKNLKILEKDNLKKNIFGHSAKILAQYYMSPNGSVISILKDENVIDHELLHMASTVCIYDEYYSGFYQKNMMHKIELGNGLNEGYTQLLTERYFIKHKHYNSYYLCKGFAYNLEQIIGRESMEKMYFRSDLYNLIRSLEKYDGEKNIIKFIANVDFICDHCDCMRSLKSKNTTKAIEDINAFLIKCYATKAKREYNEGLIDLWTFNQKVGAYKKTLLSEIITSKKTYVYLDDTKYDMILNECLIEPEVVYKYQLKKNS